MEKNLRQLESEIEILVSKMDQIKLELQSGEYKCNETAKECILTRILPVQLELMKLVDSVYMSRTFFDKKGSLGC